MPEPEAHPEAPRIIRVARLALIAGLAITLLKFAVFSLTNAAVVLSDALESIVNLAAATMVLYSIWLSSRPADRNHPYGHGKVEFMAVAVEGWLVLAAGLVIAVESVRRLIFPPRLALESFDLGMILLSVVAVLVLALGLFVWGAGRRLDSAVLIADGKHLLTDAVSTGAGVLGLLLVQLTGLQWLDPALALVVALVILLVSWRLLAEAIDGLMDRVDPEDQQRIREILEEEVARGAIVSYHKVRHRHSGRFHWVDMHLQVPADMTIRQGHAIASRIEGRVERALGEANATTHLEPASEPPPVGSEASSREQGTTDAH